ncbi:winged helix-turn-helix transcriptional regulator [Streptomyces sp. NBC_01335]|uniref:winged helix-turn-helix transcriptional regulator n=1 Tax=Streptomyces sp. NBC_01335 TaxID=2903828 RepID=UPI002E149DB4|nr:winged helix-turn-helix transcriptional regulator [Streptomyces sp. NBC_01335]
MSSPPPSSDSIGAADARRVDEALSRIAPRWTTWVIQTLAQHNRPMPAREVAAALPFTTERAIGQRLPRMQAAGLVTRPDLHGAPYQLSAAGASLSPVHRALSEWSHAHLSLGTMAGAERVEDAVRRLSPLHTTAVLQLLASGPTRFTHIAEETGMDTGSAQYRLHRLQSDGLVTRADPFHGARYLLTDAGRALGPVYASVDHWCNSIAPQRFSSTVAPSKSASRAPSRPVPPGAGSARTAAALRRSPLAPTLFSHAPQPQPWTLTAVSARPPLPRNR